MLSPEVDAYLESIDPALLPVVRSLREMILAVSPEVVESVKWNAPNYALADDFVTFSLRRQGVVQVILHTGAKQKPEHPEIVVDDPSELLKWHDRNRAIATFIIDDPTVTEFEPVVRQWVDQLR